jgi:hypothetical protein
MDSPKNWPDYQGNDASSKKLKDRFLMMLRFVHEAH